MNVHFKDTCSPRKKRGRRIYFLYIGRDRQKEERERGETSLVPVSVYLDQRHLHERLRMLEIWGRYAPCTPQGEPGYYV